MVASIAFEQGVTMTAWERFKAIREGGGKRNKLGGGVRMHGERPAASTRGAAALGAARARADESAVEGTMASQGRSLVHMLAAAVGVKPYELLAGLQYAMVGFRGAPRDPATVAFTSDAAGATPFTGNCVSLTGTAPQDDAYIATTSRGRYCDFIEIGVDTKGDDSDQHTVVQLTITGLGPNPTTKLISSGELVRVEVDSFLDANIVLGFRSVTATDTDPVLVYLNAMAGLPTEALDY